MTAPFALCSYSCVHPSSHRYHSWHIEEREEEPKSGEVSSKFAEGVEATVGFRF